MKKQPILVGEDNARRVARLAREGGSFLVADVHFDRSSIKLFRNARINFGQLGARIDVPTDLKRNREYSLRPNPQYKVGSTDEMLSSLFERIQVGKYIFQIGASFTGSMGLYCETKPTDAIHYPRGKTFFLPGRMSIEPTLLELLTFSVEEIERMLNSGVRKRYSTGIGEEEKRRMVEYALEDLRTGAVVKKNLKAGVEADMLDPYQKV